MKILVSSKSMTNKLKELDLKNNWVVDIELISDCLHIKSNIGMVCTLSVQVLEYEKYVSQIDARWDWVYQTLSKVTEQPVILEIHSRIVNVIFQY